MKKNNASKRAMFSSLLALLLCCAMLVGTTFAWFTDSVTTGRNTIKSGNLDVVLEYKTPDSEDWAVVDETTPLFNDKALWEPGYTEVVALRVKNVGSLALKYDLSTVVYAETEGVNVANEEFKLSDYLKLGHSAVQQDGEVGDIFMDLLLGSRENARGLTEVAFGASIDNPNPAILPGDAHVFALAIYMPESVGNEANHNGKDIPSVSFGINLLATQVPYEEDSFDNQYDKDAAYPDHVTTADALYDSSLESGIFTLGANVNTSDSDGHYSGNREYAITGGRDYTLNLNGHTINHDGVYQDGKNTGYTYLYTTAYNGKLTINGEGTINSANAEGHCCIVYAQGPSEVVINGGNFNAKNGIAVWAGNNGKVTINGGRFISTEGTDVELIYSSGGVIDIYGGFFHNTGWENRPVNVANANRGTGFINIYGGTFVNFDPSTGGDDPNNILVADGYKVVSETQPNGDIWYTVVPE